MTTNDRYDSLFQWYGAQHQVDWKLLKAQVRAESAFDPMARSNMGASGLAQFMPATFAEWTANLKITAPNPYNPEHSIQCQAAYMRWLLNQFEDNLDRALGAYNFGVGNEKKHKPWPTATINYVARIKSYL